MCRVRACPSHRGGCNRTHDKSSPSAPESRKAQIPAQSYAPSPREQKSLLLREAELDEGTLPQFRHLSRAGIFRDPRPLQPTILPSLRAPASHTTFPFCRAARRLFMPRSIIVIRMHLHRSLSSTKRNFTSRGNPAICATEVPVHSSGIFSPGVCEFFAGVRSAGETQSLPVSQASPSGSARLDFSGKNGARVLAPRDAD